MRTNCLLCGVGGQGTVLASKMIAHAAMEKGENVRTAETIGMAQRGGCVVSHVRVGGEIYSPLIPKGQADVIIAFEPGEGVRCLPYLKEGGTLVVNKKPVQPVTASLGANYEGEEMLLFLQKKVPNLIMVDGEKICEDCGSTKVLNMVLLATAVASGSLPISLQELEHAITNKVKESFRNLNLQAVELAKAAYLKEQGEQ